MSSHVMHGDENGISIIKERESRTYEEQQKANNGHFLRLISDCAVYCGFIAIETMNFLELPKNRQLFFKNLNRLDSVRELVNKYHGKVFEDSYYDKFRTKDS